MKDHMNQTSSSSWVVRFLFLMVPMVWGHLQSGFAKESVPEKLVVLTFDDSAKSHFTIVRPLLLQYGFGATFFVTEGFDFRDNKKDYMTWEEIAQLHKDGFEIGNHTRDHLGISDKTVEKLSEQLEGINLRCKEHGIPKPTSFAWPGNALSLNALKPLSEYGIRFARRGGGPEFPYERGQGIAYEPLLDHPLLIPSAGDARPDWELEDFVKAVDQARFGRIAVLQFHGVPDTAHNWVNTPQSKFESYMRYLASEGFRVIAMRDLENFVDSSVQPLDAWGVINDRKERIAQSESFLEFRKPTNDEELAFWLRNMLVDHKYSLVEASAATGLSTQELQDAKDRLAIQDPVELPQSVVRALPYPGGRHPRIGFREGAIRPQRETKLSLFLPWDPNSYVVADFPEAIWWNFENQKELMFLAHTHVKTTWDRTKQTIPLSEWKRTNQGWSVHRKLPNGVEFGCDAVPGKNEVGFDLWIRNGSEQVLTGLMVQNCVMLAHAQRFSELSNENKIIHGSIVACHDGTKTKWILTGWQKCARPWANSPCPCMHSDPMFEDIAPTEKSSLKGMVSFYEGADIDNAIARMQQQLDSH